MLTPSHVTFGILFNSWFFTLFNKSLWFDIPLILITVFSAIIADVDKKSSIPGKLLLPLSSFLELKYGHRTITHSFLGMFIFGIIISPLYFMNPDFLYFGLAAYFSHLFLDMLTKSGVPLLFPKLNPCVIGNNKKFRFTTGKSGEMIFTTIVVLLILASINFSKRGFVSSVNYIMGDIAHAVNEFSNAKGVVDVEFEGKHYTTGHIIKGNGTALLTKNEKLLIDHNGVLYNLGQDIVVTSVRSLAQNKPIIWESLEFNSVPIDSIIFVGRATGILKSNIDFKFKLHRTEFFDPIEVHSNKNDIEFTYAKMSDLNRLDLSTGLDSLEIVNLKIDLQAKRTKLSLIINPNKRLITKKKELSSLKSELKAKKNKLFDTPFNKRSEFKSNIKSLENKIDNFTLPDITDDIKNYNFKIKNLKIDIKKLEDKLNLSFDLKWTGTLKIRKN